MFCLDKPLRLQDVEMYLLFQWFLAPKESYGQGLRLNPLVNCPITMENHHV